MEIEISLSKAKLLVRADDPAMQQKNNGILLEADIVSGCEDSRTPRGYYKAGKLIKDKTNSKFGPIPWSRDQWGNPYGPYFLEILNMNGSYTTYGIHGTIGFDGILGVFEKPIVPKQVIEMFIDDNDARYLYCSHGCIRISNYKIGKLYSIVFNYRLSAKKEILITIGA